MAGDVERPEKGSEYMGRASNALPGAARGALAFGVNPCGRDAAAALVLPAGGGGVRILSAGGEWIFREYLRE